MVKIIMTFYQGKNRKNALRNQKHDYSSAGIYFVTIVTRNRIRWFGSVQEKRMVATVAGKIVRDCWLEIPIHYPHVRLGEFIVMPDHFHGIIRIPKDQSRTGACQHRNESYLTPVLGNIIGSFKSAATKKIRESGFSDFAWLRRYHDHIIRDNAELAIIEQYIRMNPRRGSH